MNDVVYPPVDTYLIVLRELLIAQDLASTITDRDPTARVLLAATPDEGLAALAAIPRLTAAFVSATPADFASSLLGAAIRARHGRVILLGVEAEASGPSTDWDVLVQPFDTVAVLGVLGRELG